MRKIISVLFLCTIWLGVQSSPVQAQEAKVHAILFYSPTCPHCHEVIDNVLPPLLEQYGDQLVIVGINVALDEGSALYNEAIVYYNIPANRRGVPALLVADRVLVGSVEIPQLFPGIIEQGLASGGIAWPSAPAIQDFLVSAGYMEAGGTGEPNSTPGQPDPTSSLSQNALATQAAETTANQIASQLTANMESKKLSTAELFAQDPIANSMAVIVLMGMVSSVGLCGYAFANKIRVKQWPAWVIPTLIVVGLGVSGYLAYVETTESLAVCGPVGNCNVVQQSEYARLFGVMPIGILGLLGYLALGTSWALQRHSLVTWQNRGSKAFWWLALVGVLFSIYLTYLEPFVIGATCLWCLASAIIMTILLWAGTHDAVAAMRRYHTRRKA